MGPANKDQKNTKNKNKIKSNPKISPVYKVGRNQHIGDVGEKAAREI